MKHFIFPVSDNSDAKLTANILDDGEFAKKGIRRPAVVVCPGGGYTMISINEGEPVALAYAAKGFHTFVLEYSVKIDHPFPTALRELARAMSIIRQNAEDWLLDRDNIAVIGFSAGGNLALSLGVYFNQPLLTDEMGLTEDQIRPNHVILGYPAVSLIPQNRETPKFVLDMMEQGLIPDFRGPSIQEILIGHENVSQEESASLNLIPKIHDKVPRTFVWGTYEDSLIPPTDLLGLATALHSVQVPCELHLFEKGPHGMSLCDENTKSEAEIKGLSIPFWLPLSLEWLKQGMAERMQKS